MEGSRGGSHGGGKYLSGPETPEIYFLILIFTTLVLVSCVQSTKTNRFNFHFFIQAKNFLMQRKSLFLGKK